MQLSCLIIVECCTNGPGVGVPHNNESGEQLSELPSERSGADQDKVRQTSLWRI